MPASSTHQGDITVTIPDQTPRLAVASLVPILRAFTRAAGIHVHTKDISLSTRILALWDDSINDDLSDIAHEIESNPKYSVIKLPNISATIPQIKEAIAELRQKGHENVPEYPDNPHDKQEEWIKGQYDKIIKGSKVNPILRLGNSLRGITKSVKEAAKKAPHKMGKWTQDVRTHVAHMSEGDFYETEKSITAADHYEDLKVRIEFAPDNPEEKPVVLKTGLPVNPGDIIDGAVMDRAALRRFLQDKITEAEEKDLPVSAHYKATMMTETDGRFFGDTVEVFFEDVFKKHADIFADLNVDSSEGMNNVYAAIGALSPEAVGTLKNLGGYLTEGDNGSYEVFFDTQKGQEPVSEDLKEKMQELGFECTSAESGQFIRLHDASKITAEKRREIENDINEVYEKQPQLALTDPKTGKRNLDDPSMIIDISMANLIRWSTMPVLSKTKAKSRVPAWLKIPDFFRKPGKGNAPTVEEKETMAIIPDRTYAKAYQAAIDHFKKNGSLNPAKAGTFVNIGLMAEKAEEYGSKDTTFEAPGKGKIRIIAENGENGNEEEVLLEHDVQEKDVWRMCKTTDRSIQDWIKTTLEMARKNPGKPFVFWLDENRAHDRELKQKLETYIAQEKSEGIDLPDNIQIMNPEDAMVFTLDQMSKGIDVYSATGNVFRDYLTDLVPILEIGSNSKLYSLVHLFSGGLLAETGAGGTAADLYKRFHETGEISWDSLAEAIAIVEVLKYHKESLGNEKAGILAETFDRAVGKLIEGKFLPSDGLNTRQHHFHMARLWAEELSAHDGNKDLKDYFSYLASEIHGKQEEIMAEIQESKGKPVNIYGHYAPDKNVVKRIMMPPAFTEILQNLPDVA